MRFQHESHRQRVYFGTGSGAADVADAVGSLGGLRAMVIASERARPTASALTAGVDVVHVHTEVTMHVPVDVAERARAAAVDCAADVLISVGGGSATGLAKAIALTAGLPIVAVPTTYSGSEATTIWGLTDRTGKTTGTDERVLPRAVVYDTELTMSLGVDASVASGFNALAHCVDAMWAPRADPINQALACEGVRALTRGLPAVVADPAALPGRESVLYATYLAGVALSSAGSGLHHKICHLLGGRYNLPHAQTHAIVLPYVLAYNAPAVPDVARRIGEALGSPDDAVGALSRLARELDAPSALRDIGFHADDIDAAAAEVARVTPASNPVPVTVDSARALLHGAFAGSDPTRIVPFQPN